MPNCGEYRCLMLPISNDITYVLPLNRKVGRFVMENLAKLLHTRGRMCNELTFPSAILKSLFDSLKLRNEEIYPS